MIDWDELAEGHNRIYGTSFETPADMVDTLYVRDQMSSRTIADRLGVSDATVRVKLKVTGIKLRRVGYRIGTGSKSYKQCILSLRCKFAKTVPQIAEAVGCSKNYCWDVMRKHGINYKESPITGRRKKVYG